MTRSRWYLGVEWSVIFLGVPLLLSMKPLHLPYLLLLLLVMLWCLVLLHQEATFSLRHYHDSNALVQYWPVLLPRFLAFALISTLCVMLFTPSALDSMRFQRPEFWLFLLLLYPLLSAYPQEMIYRVFFFQRYRPLFRHEGLLIAASITSFTFLHIIYHNAVAVTLSFLGGILFTLTYVRSKSVIVTAVEHALYGMWIFTIGLGSYFSSGY